MDDGAGREDFLYEKRDDIAYVTFNRPQARNSMTFEMYERLTETSAEVDADPAVKVLVIMGQGDRAFAAGTDISQFRAFESEQDALDYEARIDRVLGALERVGKPTIAAIAGACTGGGAGIAVACDMRIGTRDMRFGFPVARTLGNCLSMTNYARLAALIGPALTKDIMFTSRLIEAEEARATGILNEVVDDHAALLARADELARLLAGQAPLTLRATKEALLRLRPQIPEGEGHDLIRMCYMSEDFREGMDAFLSKRKPHWKGR